MLFVSDAGSTDRLSKCRFRRWTPITGATCQVLYRTTYRHGKVDSPLNLERFTLWTSALLTESPLEARRLHAALNITFHCGTEKDRQTGVPELAIPGVMGLGPAPWEWCAAPDCVRCLGGEGSYYVHGPFRTGGLGGFHFRHIGPWTGDAEHPEKSDDTDSQRQ